MYGPLPRTYRELLAYARRLPQGEFRHLFGQDGIWAHHWLKAVQLAMDEERRKAAREAQGVAARGSDGS